MVLHSPICVTGVLSYHRPCGLSWKYFGSNGVRSWAGLAQSRYSHFESARGCAELQNHLLLLRELCRARRALRPLRPQEKTAIEIAAGDSLFSMREEGGFDCRMFGLCSLHCNSCACSDEEEPLSGVSALVLHARARSQLEGGTGLLLVSRRTL